MNSLVKIFASIQNLQTQKRWLIQRAATPFLRRNGAPKQNDKHKDKLMIEYLVRMSSDRENIIKIKTVRLELRDGALLFYFLDETEGYKIQSIIAAGEWIEVLTGIKDNE